MHPRTFTYIEAETICRNPVTGKRLDIDLYESHTYGWLMDFSVRSVNASINLPIGAICRKRTYGL